MKEIVVVSDSDLLMVGIERLLKKTADFSILQLSTREEKEIIRFIQETGSNIVILDGSYEKNGFLMPARLLNEINGLRLLIMNIDSNHIQIYDKREGSLDHSTNLADYF